MVLSYHAKNHPKRSSGSWDIKLTRIERSDWPRAFWSITREPDCSWTCGFRRKLGDHKVYRFKVIPVKTNDSIFQKSRKTLILGHFGPFLPKFGQMRFFLKNRALSVFITYCPLTSCKKSEKTNEPILRKSWDRLTDWLTDWQTRVIS